MSSRWPTRRQTLRPDQRSPTLPLSDLFGSQMGYTSSIWRVAGGTDRNRKLLCARPNHPVSGEAIQMSILPRLSRTSLIRPPKRTSHSEAASRLHTRFSFCVSSLRACSLVDPGVCVVNYVPFSRPASYYYSLWLGIILRSVLFQRVCGPGRFCGHWPSKSCAVNAGTTPCLPEHLSLATLPGFHIIIEDAQFCAAACLDRGAY